MKKIKKYDIPMNEVIDTGPSEIVEKFLDVSEVENEKNNSLVRIDINMIEYPLFTKSTSKKKNQIIRYFFNRSKEAYIQVNPTSGDYIPGELEERVFIALLKIMRDKRYNNVFYTTISEVLVNMGIAQESFKGFYGRISKALIRLSQTSYTFKNSLYSNKIKGIIEEQINTNIMNIHMVSLKQAKESEKELFTDRRIKEIIKVSISDHFYDNIIRKGYLVYDSQLLLSMDSPITRGLYMLINKLRFNKMYIKVLSINLIKRIPLSENIQKIGRTIKVIEKSCEELKKMNLIKDYNIIKNSKWIESEVEFFFSEEHNALKQSYFYNDKNHFDNLLITHTDGGENIVADDNKKFAAVKAETIDRIPTEEKISKIYDVLPPKAKELKTLKKVIKDGIRQYGFEYLKDVAEYMKVQKVGNIRSYMIQALAKGWADDYIANRKNTAEVDKNKKQLTIESMDAFEEKRNEASRELLKEMYQHMSKNQKEIVENEAYKDYILLCGVEGKIQKMAFNAAKEKLIIDYLEKNIGEYTTEAAKKEKPITECIEETLYTSENNWENSDQEIEEIEIFSIEDEIENTTEVDKNKKDRINQHYTEEKIINTTEMVKKLKENREKEVQEEIKTINTAEAAKNIMDTFTAEVANSEIESNTTEVDKKEIKIRKKYKNMSMYQLELLDILDGENMKEVNKIIRLLGITKFFEGELGNLYVKLEYSDDEGIIEVYPHKKK